jgi:UDPglucose--hexose-1-phosphate uridylyltransferase
MYILELTTPDGRSLTLYSSQPIAPKLQAPSPFPHPQGGDPHLRWRPLRGESVTRAACLHNRTDQPPQCNRLAATLYPANPSGDASILTTEAEAQRLRAGEWLEAAC